MKKKIITLYFVSMMLISTVLSLSNYAVGLNEPTLSNSISTNEKKSSASNIIKENNQIKPIDNSIFSDNNNIWTPEDEGDHFPCTCEWWWIYATLKLDNGEHWDVALMFSYWMTRTKNGYEPGLSYYRVQSWDRESGDSYDLLFENEEYPNPYFQHKKNVVDLKYYNCTMKGLYPNYVIHAEDFKNNISFNLKFCAEANPFWVAEESTGGFIPYGFSGIFRYGLIPRNNVTGNISINGSNYNVTGVGYYEHQFGDMDVLNPYKIHSIPELFEIKNLWSDICRWWAKEVISNTREPLTSVYYSIDNLLGYDYIWATFDNGYSIVLFRIAVFGQAEGRVPALLMLSDGETCWEFGDVYLDLIDTFYIKEYDIYIPVDMELTAYKGEKVFHIFFNSTTEITEAIDEDEILASYLLAGDATGYYYDGEKNHSLEGVGTNTPARNILNLKYSSFEINLPPSGIGISIIMKYHIFEYEVFIKIKFRPFEVIFCIKPIEY